MDITQKSTGFLIDELITARFKVEVNPIPENIQRVRMLDAVIRLGLNGREDSIYLQVVKLQVVLRQCWVSQEEIMKHATLFDSTYVSDRNFQQLVDLGQAAIKAQHTNAQRNQLIREIDTILGESDVSVLGKTYA
jgi:hypothetical protein